MNRMRRRLAGVLPLIALLLLSACGERPYRQQAYVFGTLVEVTIAGVDEPRARAATDQVLREFDRMHQSLHAWQPGVLDQVNAALARATPANPARVSLSPELAAMLRDARAMSIRGDGLFNPAIGNLVRLWGFHDDQYAPRLPDPAEVARLVAAAPSMADLRFEGDTLIGANPAVRLDLGGYAKGHALDRAAASLRAAGIDNALINIGGNILALGDKGGKPWTVGIQHPRRAGALATLELRDGEAIGTSGDYQRYFEIDGRRYCHLIDPRDGQPVQHTQAATVIAAGAGAGTLSDVASKPVFIAGSGGWRAMATRMGIAEALYIGADGGIQVTRALHARLRWPEPAPAIRIID